MTSAQKIIKYFAIGFAFCIIIGIFSLLMFGLSEVSNYFDNNDTKVMENLKEMNINAEDVSILNIDIKYANLIIKPGDNLKVETNNKYITNKQDENKLIISEKKHNWFNKEKSDLIIYIPQNIIFDGVSIETGAGIVEIDSLSTKILEFNLGAGKTSINNLIVSGNAEIDGGAGELTILNGNINNLDIDTGVGKCTLRSELIGNNEIDVGVGELNITLLGNKEDYRVIAEKGIGSIKLENENIKSEQAYGVGTNNLNVSGGVGSININFE